MSVNTKELAVILNVSHGRIRQYVRDGIITPASIISFPNDGTRGYVFDAEKAKSEVSKYISPKHESQRRAVLGGKSKPSDMSDRDQLLAAKLRREVAMARLKEIEIAEAEGRLVDAKTTADAAFSMARRVRDAMMNIPDRISAILAAQPDEHEVRKLLVGEIRSSLEELSRDEA